MSSFTLSLDTQASVVIGKIEEMQEAALEFIGAKGNPNHRTECNGFAIFKSSTVRYNFDNMQDLTEVRTEDLSDLYIWELNFFVYDVGEYPEAYPWGRTCVMDVNFRQDNLNAVAVRISHIDYASARRLIDALSKLLECTIVRITPEDRKRAERLKAQEQCVSQCISIFNRLPELQARITRTPQSEKDVQEFVYPILKSHFPGMQEEDYLPKVAGTSSKPDFGVWDLGVVIEIKYLGENKSFKKLAEELHDDSRKYFGKSSPYEAMVVLIYNGASRPTPANFIADLENIDVIGGVVISPNIIPDSQSKA